MDPDDLRTAMPAVDEVAYLNTGASSPAPRPVVEAATDYLEELSYRAPAEGRIYEFAIGTMADARERIARFLGVKPQSIALTQSTVEGVNLIVSSIDWEPGDVVVRTDLEHPAVTLPLERIADLQDVDVRTLSTTDGRLDMDALGEAVADARLVVVSSITWSHGTQLPVGRIVEIAHDADTRVLVDAVQSTGQRPLDLEVWGADFVAGSGHKWSLGLPGSGYLYVAPEAVDSLTPRRIGYFGVEDPGAAAYSYRDGAARFELGTRAVTPHVGLATGMELLAAVGMDAIQGRIERLTDRLKDGLGDRLVSPREYESGLVTFRVENPEETVDRLAERGVIVRSLPFPEGALRASVHAFNNAEDVDRLLDAL